MEKNIQRNYDQNTLETDEDIRIPTTRNLYFAVFTVCVACVSAGFVLGYSAPALPSLSKDPQFLLNPTASKASWIGSLITLGALTGGLVGGPMIAIFGRRRTLIISTLPMITGWVFISSAQNVWMIYFGRFLTGFNIGVGSLAAPIYLAEISPPQVRGMLVSCFQLSATLGFLLVYACGIVAEWRALGVIAIALPITFGFLMFFMPESPVSLIQRNKHEEGMDALLWLRGHSGDVEEEFDQIQAHMDCTHKQTGGFGDVIKPAFFKPLCVSVVLMILQQFSGINAVLFYTSTIFENAGSSLKPAFSTLIIGFVQVIGTLVCVISMDRVGRRVLLLTSSFGTSTSLLILGVYYKIKDDYVNLGWLPLVCLLLFVFMYSLAFGAVPWLLMSEIIPYKTKAVSTSIVGTINWACSFIVTRTFQVMIEGINEYGTYWFLSGMCILSVVFIYFFVPETKGKSLQDIEDFFAGRTSRDKLLMDCEE